MKKNSNNQKKTDITDNPSNVVNFEDFDHLSLVDHRSLTNALTSDPKVPQKAKIQTFNLIPCGLHCDHREGYMGTTKIGHKHDFHPICRLVLG